MEVSIKCESCGEVPLEVLESNCCAQIYCWNCVLNSNLTCKCGKRITSSNVELVPELQEIVDANTISYCSNAGCNYSGSKLSLKEHVKQCEYQLVNCPNGPCGSFQKANLLEHYEHCNYVWDNCQFCNLRNQRCKLVDHYCPSKLIECENCKEMVRYIDLPNHKQNTCPLTERPCSFQKYGCAFTGTKDELAIHMQQEDHFDLVEKHSNYNEQRIQMLEYKLNNALSLFLLLLGICYEAIMIPVSSVRRLKLIEQTNRYIHNVSRATLIQIILFFFIASLMPMKFFIIRAIFTAIAMRRVWVDIFRPAMRQARHSFLVFEQTIYLIMFVGLTVLFSFYLRCL